MRLLDLSSVGYTAATRAFTYDWRAPAIYALGIGARRDALGYLYEGARGGMAVYPTFAVIPAHALVVEMLGKCGGELTTAVHGGQMVRLHRAIPPSGTIEVSGRIAGIYDARAFGRVVLEIDATLAGEPLFETEWSILFRGGGGFGGAAPPAEDEATPPAREPDWCVEAATSPEQALLYRVSADVSPLHADPEFAAMAGFPQGPILHGLCTYGFAARAIIDRCAGGDGTKLRAFAARFRKPVWPGDTLVIQGWSLAGGRVVVAARAAGRPELVLSNGWAELEGREASAIASDTSRA